MHPRQTRPLTVTPQVPFSVQLEQNFPNPFNPTTRIRFRMGQRGFASLRIYNLLGAEVASLVNQEIEAGTHDATFDAQGLASGVYFYRLEVRDGSHSGTISAAKRLVLLR